MTILTNGLSHGLKVKPLAPAIGVEIVDVNLKTATEETFGAIRSVLVEHQVVIFRSANLTDQEQLDLSAQLGTLRASPLNRMLGKTEPEVSIIQDGGDVLPQTGNWHTDITWTADPPDFAMLRAMVVPEKGGATRWGSMTAAFDALPEDLANHLCTLTAVHNNESFVQGFINTVGVENSEALGIPKNLRSTYPPVRHPLVRVNPESGRKSIFWGGSFLSHIEGIDAAASSQLLEQLRTHIENPDFHCEWEWNVGDVGIWDERSTIHRGAADHSPEHREIRRVEIGGDIPVGPVPA